VAAEINADLIEIHTGNYANASGEEEIFDELERIRLAAKHAKKLGLGVNAGHGLNYINMKEFVAIPDIDEVSIGQAVVARSVFVGVEQAIKEMIALVRMK
jgi:pyridoxine 5-phosphate synthase